MFRLLTTTSLFCSALSLGVVSAARAQDQALQARAEVNWRYGTERSILMSEFWVPLAQDEESVLYGDYRMMGDDQDNREFNAGVGYRKITDFGGLKGVAGVHGWFDRRHTARGSTFNQVTLGGEWLSDSVDVLVNSYIPLNDDKTHTQENPRGTNPRLAGSQIVVNTDQVVVEEALLGVDLELGWNFPFLKEHMDSVRVYGGGYHFEGDKAENVSGWRTRLAADITPDIQIGARFQRDDVRGSQGFLEATIRFPFGQKQSYRKKGLYARLDDSPERDIDIVSNEAITDDGFDKPVINPATGASQNVIHVKNTAAGGGDGSAESPYNTLAAAEAAAGANDLIYVHRGDGTSTNMAAGIDIDDDGQKLIGAGSNVTLGDLGLQTANGLGLSAGTTILEADPLGNPTITNGGGDGVSVRADNVTVAGVTVDGATRFGVYVLNNSGMSWDNVKIQNVMAQNNANYGLRTEANGAGSTISNVLYSNNTANNNGNNGFLSHARNSGTITTVTYIGNTAQNNTNSGFFDESDGAGSTISNVLYSNNIADNNSTYGFQNSARNSGTITTATYTDNTAQNNSSDGFRSQANGAGSSIATMLYSNNTADSNGTYGFLSFAQNSGAITTSTYTNNTAKNNTSYGLYIVGSTNGVLNVEMESSVYTNNGSHGVYVNDDTTGAFTVDLGGGSLGSTGGNSIHSNTGTDIRVDLDGGELKAENNWWGVNTGLAGGEVTLDSGSTIDADPFLTEAP